MKKAILTVLVLGLVAWPSLHATSAQEEEGVTIIILPYVFGDDPSSVFDSLYAPPVVALADAKVGHPGPFANRHVWRISENGQDPKVFDIDDFFDLSFDLVLLGTSISPRKEAGFLITTAFAGEGQFIVNTDAHEVVAFGGPFPFFAFEPEYDSGETISLRLRYFRDEDGLRKVEYVADGVSSGPLEITNAEQGFTPPFTVGGYVQIVIDEGNLDNHAVAVFDNIRWNGELIDN